MPWSPVCRRRFMAGWPDSSVRFGRFYRYFIIRYISTARLLCDADELLQRDRTSKPITCSYNIWGRSTRAFMKLLQKCLVTKHSEGLYCVCSGQVGIRNFWIVHIRKFNSIIQMGNEQFPKINSLWLSLVVTVGSALLISEGKLALCLS